MTGSGRPIAITQGDIAGIGPEIVVQAFRDAPAQTRDCLVFGDVAAITRAAQVLAQQHPHLPAMHVWPLKTREDWTRPRPMQAVPVWQQGRVFEAHELPSWGQISASAGRSAADCVYGAAQAALRGEIAAMVTAPLHKEALVAAGVPFPGHTELLQACAAAHMGVAVQDMPVRMMLANPDLRTVLVSIHVSLRQAIDAVTFDNVLETLRITHTAHLSLTGQAPKIAVAGLNPHAGEGGLMGREELDIIIPAVQQAQRMGLQVSGPYPPDTVFMRARGQSGRSGEFDVVVAMYHDQGLIPVKYLGLTDGVNVTLGLPLVRTSPDHGTAFDLAGTAQADASSLLAALGMARRLVGRS